jgi:hypothetical protein
MTDPAEAPAEPPSETCQADNGRCPGVRLDDADRCLAHAKPSARASALQGLAGGAPLAFARGVPFTTQLLADLLDAAPTDDHDHPVLRDADFTLARFQGDAHFGEAIFQGGGAQFGGATFQGNARFGGATFQGIAHFHGTTFQGDADFTWTRFEGHAWFVMATFQGDARFDGENPPGEATFQDGVQFDGATFRGNARFGGATFRGNAQFGGATFLGDTQFGGATFEGNAQFGGATFLGDTQFGGATFQGNARFDAVSFQGPTRFGPLSVTGRLELRQAVLARPVRFEITAATVLGTEFRLEGGGGTIGLDNPAGGALLDRAVLAQPLTLTAVESRAGVSISSGKPTTAGASRRARGRLSQPKVLGVRGVDASNLVLTDLDLGVCQVAGAHHLDQLRIEGLAAFAESPRGWQVGWGWPPAWRWSRRQVLVEERAWRAATGRGARRLGWLPLDDPGLRLFGEHVDRLPSVLGAERIAGLYRSLRKAQEDAKNEPGAADLYYGECEMRRHASGTPWAERGILWLYWLVAGYGLRGLRSLVCLAVLVAGVALALQQVGFPPGHPVPSLVALLVFTTQSVVSLETRLAALGRDFTLTGAGDGLRLLVRVLGPVLLALALLSIRNRVKR